ncbi:hypothetical protein CMO90_03310 [Candidatus Woesearchaeota archaeon]|jgi:glycosyltransferase involved in cell wall biosynthesis|nr:hypothetical protein [Candidatus Woesearchaeota archaeon]|tara:strand:+ start:3145 stop:4266 length:1122 start_codon:yes stop_codon:yes gene_type:complete
MKLVIATDNYLPRWDGISRFLSEITPKISKEHEIIVIAPDFGETKQDFKVFKIPLTKIVFGDFQIAKFKYFKIRSIIKNADAVFTQTIGPIGIASILAAKRLSKPLISFIHNIEWELFPKATSLLLMKKIFYPTTKKLVKSLYNKCDLLIVPADNIADMLSWQNIKTMKRVVHLGVDANKFTKGNKRQSKKKIGLKSDDLVIGYHGRLGREKNLKTLLRAFVRVKSNHKNVNLLLIGSGPKDVEKMFYKKKGVIFSGRQNNVVPFIQAMDIYVLPSLTETTSLSTLEAMSCEVAVISTKVGFVKDYIKNGFNGLLFDKQNAYDLYKKIDLLIRKSELRKKLGKNARQTVSKNFVWSVTSTNIMEAINGVLKKN